MKLNMYLQLQVVSTTVGVNDISLAPNGQIEIVTYTYDSANNRYLASPKKLDYTYGTDIIATAKSDGITILKINLSTFAGDIQNANFYTIKIQKSVKLPSIY